jgi:DNA replication and repair protein RecF
MTTALSEKIKASTTSNTILSIASVSLQQFRNYEGTRIETTGAPVVLSGNNGAGKTNILEAISLLTPGRGLRRARLSELGNIHTASAWAVSANICGMQGEVQIGTGRDPQAEEASEKRLLKIDGKPARSHAELGRHMAMIWLTPQMEQLFQEGASAGRKFLDRLVYSFDPEHATRVNEYEYAMRERNRLLQTGGYDSAWLDALEQTMSETGAAIAQARLSTAANINHAIMASQLGFPKAHVAVHGVVEDQLQSGQPALYVEEQFKAQLRQQRPQDAAAGRAVIGSHRSELRVLHVDKGMQAETCSTGEQKAVLLSIVLAQARAAAAWKGVIPVLLLDEVIAHLDATRKLELFQEICQIGAQVWMTGTDPNIFADLRGKAQFFQVKNGTVNHV